MRLLQGKKESATVYSDKPWELAAGFVAAGATRVHVVDLDAAFSGGGVHNRPIVARIIEAAGIEVEVGGGIRSEAACDAIFAAGARYAVLGTAAIESPELVEGLCRKHPGRIVVAVDARNGKVAVRGWTQATESLAVDIGRRVAGAGAAAVLYTDIGRDGMQTGPDLEATRLLATAIAPCPVIASGGVAQLSDLDSVARTGAAAVVVGKAIYERAFSVEEAVARARGPDRG